MELIIPAFPAAGGGVGDVLPVDFPADFIALLLHVCDKLFSALGVLHALVYGVHQLKFDALPLHR